MSYLGFDISEYPGDAMMAWLKTNTILTFCGFYLAPTPSHTDEGWMSKRETLQRQGWGFAPVYVGAQGFQDTPHIVESAHTRGVADGKDAVALMHKAGFLLGTSLFLDVETGGSLSAQTVQYINDWIDAVDAGDRGEDVRKGSVAKLVALRWDGLHAEAVGHVGL